MYPLPGQEAAEGVEPLGAVVVAGNDHDLRSWRRSGQFGEKPIEQRHGFRRRNGFIIDISGDHHRVGGVFGGHAGDLSKNMLLILPKVPVVQSGPDMQI